MLEDTNVSILITQAHLKDRFKYYTKDILCLKLDEISRDLKVYYKQNISSNSLKINLSTYPSYNLSTVTFSHNTVYVIYTSGSTGKPKGIENVHRSLGNRLYWTSYNYRVTERDTCLYIASEGFDISVWEMLFPLTNGAILVVAGKEKNKDVHSIMLLINIHKINTLHFVPSFLDSFINLKNHEDCGSIIQVITGGESLSNEIRKNFITSFKDTSLYLAYGPTESAISVTHWDCCKGEYISKNVIGKPISNTQIYILDKFLNPVPIGVSGEIYIGGEGLARGYLNRPDLTAEKFIPNPFVNEEEFIEDGTRNNEGRYSLRLYRTGDLGRYLFDGNIEFLGRIDDQVKIRGFRIELGEIESTLQNHGDVSQAVVNVREDEPGHKYLVAYIVAKEEVLASCDREGTFNSSNKEELNVLGGSVIVSLIDDLRSHLGRILPDYMVPSFFVFIDKVPLTANGKIDRKSLPAPDKSLRQVGEEYVAPCSELERELCTIWSEVLRIERIGIYDNFFKIGGDSIISIQLVAKARQKRIYFSVRDIFNNPTISKLIPIIQEKNVSLNEVLSVKAEQELVEGDIPLTPIQHYFFNLKFKSIHHYNQAVLLQINETVDSDLLKEAFRKLLQHHDILRCRYSKDSNNTWKQTNLKQEDINSIYTTIDCSSVDDKDFASKLEQEANLFQQAINIEKGPLIKVVWFDSGEKRWSRLLIVIHHLVIDGVSWRILLEDLECVYRVLRDRKEVILPSKTHSYQQWGQSLISYAQSDYIKQQISYWQGIESVIKPLPIDFDKGVSTSTNTIIKYLTREETAALLQEVPKAYRTQINDILLTALVLAIGDWTKEYSLSFVLEGHGREDIIEGVDISRTIGWFTSLFPVYLSINNPDDIGGAIKSVKEALRKIPDKGIGYGILKYMTQGKPLSTFSSVADLGLLPTSSKSNNPSLLFNYLGQWDNTFSQDELFKFSDESAGIVSSEDNYPFYPLSVNSVVRDGILYISWEYSINHYKSETMIIINKYFVNRLKDLITHCSDSSNFGYTLSDFDIKVKDIDELVQRLNLIDKV